MARVFNSGAELNTATAGIEFDTTTGGGSIAPITADAVGSRYQWQTTDSIYTNTAFLDAETTNDYYSSLHFMIDTWGNTINATVFFEYTTAAGQRNLQLRLTNARVLQLLSYNDTVLVTGPTLAVGQVYHIETHFAYGAGGSTGYLRVDNVDYGSGQVSNGALHTKIANVIWGSIGGSTTTTLLNFDNIIINDSTGANENTWVGDQRLLFSRASVQGHDANTDGTPATYHQKQGGGAASGDNLNYQEVDEVTPDDATSYFRKNTNNAFRDWLVPESLATMGSISSTDDIKCLSVGGRIGANGASARQFKYCITPDGTWASATFSSFLNANANAWFMYDVNDHPSRPLFITYPAIKASAIADYEFGVESADDTTASNTRYTTVWLEISYAAPTGTSLLSCLGAG